MYDHLLRIFINAYMQICSKSSAINLKEEHNNSSNNNNNRNKNKRT
jgi:hypothetical protein